MKNLFDVWRKNNRQKIKKIKLVIFCLIFIKYFLILAKANSLKENSIAGGEIIQFQFLLCQSASLMSCRYSHLHVTNVNIKHVHRKYKTMYINNIKQGTIIKAPNWPEPVEIKFIEEVGEYIHIIGATKNSREHIDQLISNDEFSKFKLDEYKTSFAEESWKVFLALETTRYRFASMYDPLLAMNTSKVDPLPHQIEAVYG